MMKDNNVAGLRLYAENNCCRFHIPRRKQQKKKIKEMKSQENARKTPTEMRVRRMIIEAS